MSYQALISAGQLRQIITQPDWVVVDCRFSLKDLSAGRRAFLAGHIPGAVYADLEKDLCGPIVPGTTGRHPLPEVPFFIQRLRALGINQTSQVVVYDDKSGAFAARLWWMLRWIGHKDVAVLDGGWQAWLDAGFPVNSEQVEPVAGNIAPDLQNWLVVTSDELVNRLGDDQIRILDARERVRYLGLEEPIDAIAGHIPGAESCPYLENLNPDGRFKTAAELRKLYMHSGESTRETIVYCGSGVTAAADLLALEIAGLGPARLYVGSWSEWITDPVRPLASGENPEIRIDRRPHEN
jgi:thiosulfate/3-mercaptopyruvate sulfurtransferase